MQRQQPIAGSAARDESRSVSNWNCSVCNNSFRSGDKGYTRCAQHASNPRCHCYQVSQGQAARAAPQLVHTVFRSADRNVGGRQHLEVSVAAEAIGQPEALDAVESDAPNSDSESPNKQVDSSGQLQCHNGKFASELYHFHLNIHESLQIFFEYS